MVTCWYGSGWKNCSSEVPPSSSGKDFDPEKVSMDHSSHQGSKLRSQFSASFDNFRQKIAFF
jgi:hypothetical protein